MSVIRDFHVGRETTLAQKQIALAFGAVGASKTDLVVAAFKPGFAFEIVDIQHLFPTATAPTVGAPAAGANTGNGTFSATPTAGAAVEAGTYTFLCIAAAANAGTFRLTSPSGVVLGNVTVGTPYVSTHLTTFTLQDGATDFIVGDIFTCAVTAKASYKTKVGSNVADAAAVTPIANAPAVRGLHVTTANRRGSATDRITVEATTASASDLAGTVIVTIVNQAARYSGLPT